MRQALALIFVALFAQEAMAMDWQALWNFDDAAGSEQRFREAMHGASADDALLLETQIARCYGLRSDFATAREVLAGVESKLGSASPTVQAYYYLELGRTYASVTADAQSDVTRQHARDAYERAIAIAAANGLDGVQVDALHMLAFVDTAPADQLKWARAALAVAEASSQPDARRWAASLHNNIGYALHEEGKLDEALAEFESIRIARWMIAWTLRGLERYDVALAMQLQLEREYAKLNKPSADVYDELEALYRAKGDVANAAKYAALRRALASGPGQ
jgi:hypothetical protein